ncbi:MAG: hypothetical protein ACI93G_001594 [Hyphomonas sp.]|jgi:hypothetical protein
MTGFDENLCSDESRRYVRFGTCAYTACSMSPRDDGTSSR